MEVSVSADNIEIVNTASEPEHSHEIIHTRSSHRKMRLTEQTQSADKTQGQQ